MKYSRLDHAELSKLEKEFIDFLVLNGITSEDWEKIKDDEEKAEGMIEAFSDVVWEGVLQNTQFLIRPTSNSLYAFSFGTTQATLLIAHSDDEITSTEGWLEAEGLKVQYQAKPLVNDRQKEIFDLIQQGCLISEGKYYKHLALLFAKAQNG